MNRRLIDPFQSVQPPELIEEYLEPRGSLPCITTCLAFNRRGTILASGTHDGQVILWDWDTRGEARVLQGHSGAVVGVCWSRNGRYLASACAGGLLVLWDVLEGTQEVELNLPCGATWVSLTARRPYKCLVSLVQGPPLLIDLEGSKQQRRIPMLSAADLKLKPSKSQGGADEDARGGAGPGASAGGSGAEDAGAGAGGSPPPDAEQGLPGVAVFHKSGDLVLVGYAKGGLLAALDVQSLEHVDLVKLSNVPQVQGMVLNRQATLLIVNCHDRTLRLFSLASRKRSSPSPGLQLQGANGNGQASHGHETVPFETVRSKVQSSNFKALKPGSLLCPDGGGVLQHARDFTAPVERCAWASCCFSADSEHIVAAAASKAHHHIYMWNTVVGMMDKVMEGPADGVAAIAWHPLRTWLCTSGTPSSRIYIWGRAYAENWSAFAPDFKELDENTEYVEAEDEFDVQPAGSKAGEGGAERQGSVAVGGGLPDVEVDVLCMEPDCVFTSDEEDEEESPDEQQLHHLPVEIELEEEEVPEGEELEEGAVKMDEGEEGLDAQGLDQEQQGMEGLVGGEALQGQEEAEPGSGLMLLGGASDSGAVQEDLAGDHHLDGQLDDGAWLDGMVVEAQGGLSDPAFGMLMD